MFKKHYNNYKPTLDQIKNFDILSLKSSSEAANLAELKHNNFFFLKEIVGQWSR